MNEIMKNSVTSSSIRAAGTRNTSRTPPPPTAALSAPLSPGPARVSSATVKLHGTIGQRCQSQCHTNDTKRWQYSDLTACPPVAGGMTCCVSHPGSLPGPYRVALSGSVGQGRSVGGRAGSGVMVGQDSRVSSRGTRAAPQGCQGGPGCGAGAAAAVCRVQAVPLTRRASLDPAAATQAPPPCRSAVAPLTLAQAQRATAA